MEEKIEKRKLGSKITNKFNLAFEQEQYILTLRKNRLESQLLKRRLSSAKPNHGINLEEIKITSELKAPEFINKIISLSSYDELFIYINEIYNTNNYQPDLFKYGLYLLKHKLLDENSTNKNIPSLIQNGFFDIPKKIFQYSQTQMDKSPSNDIDDLIYDLYWILINYSYYATEQENAPLLTEDYLAYHYFLLKNESNDYIISNIINFLANLACHSYALASLIIEYQNDDLLELIIQYILSGVNHKKYSIVSTASDLLYSYINSIKSDKPKEIKETIIEKIFNVFINLIHIKTTYYNSIWTLSLISSLSPIIFDNIFECSDVFSAMISFNYTDDINNNNNSECLIPFSKIISNLFKNNNGCEQKYIELHKILELNVFDFITNILHEYKTSQKIKKQYLKAIYAICNYDKRFTVYLINRNVPLIKLMIGFLRDPHYIIKEKTIDIFYLMTRTNSFTITSSLVANGLMKMILYIIKPELTFCLDCNIILKCLKIINTILLTGEWIKSINKFNSLAVKYESMGGRDILEKYLGHPNKEVYLASQSIIDNYY